MSGTSHDFCKIGRKGKADKFSYQAWNELWKSDIVIEGDPQSQQDIHSMLYHLYSFSREGTALSPSPMGLSGLGYNGHVFLGYRSVDVSCNAGFASGIAKSMIEYRFSTSRSCKEKRIQQRI
jgi:trehalose/maltose hydrolase-like predicted phosphorylase